MDNPSILTDEERLRIENEERKRVAEDRYRAEVRAKLSDAAAQTSPVEISRSSPEVPGNARTRMSRAWVAVAGVAIVLCSGALTLEFFRPAGVAGSKSASSQAPVPVAAETADPSKPSALVAVPVKLTTAQIAEHAAPFVVVVESFGADGEKLGQGSGYIYGQNGPVITNYHVIRGASRLVVKTHTGLEVSTETILGYDTKADLAALDVPSIEAPGKEAKAAATAESVIDGVVRQGFEETKKRNQDFFARQAGNPPAPPAGESKPERPSGLETDSTSEVGVGDRVVAIGAPLGLESTVSEGIVSAVRDFGTIHIIQTTASISPGSSGGPLLNEYGKVVGITAATLRNGQNLNLAISSRHVATLLSQSRPLSLSAMLTETLVTDPVGQTTVFVPARQATTLQFVVAQQQGVTLEGSYTISGGMGHDAGVWIVGPDNNVIVNSGRVSGYGQVKQKLAPGRYTMVFDNRFSMMSGKSISPDLHLIYYR